MVSIEGSRGTKRGNEKELAEAHAIAIAMGRRALVVVASRTGVGNLAEDDYPGRATVNAQSATGAHVVVDREDEGIGGVVARPGNTETLRHGVGFLHVDTFPWTDVHATLAGNAF